MFSQDDINKIYNEKVKLPNSYFTKYAQVPKCPIKSYNYTWAGHDYPRVWCTLDFIEWINKYGYKYEITHGGLIGGVYVKR